MEYCEVTHIGCQCKVTRNGEVQTKNGKDEWVDREWRYNSDGYVVVAAVGRNSQGKKIYRSIQVHILVAKAWLPNPDNKPEVNHKDFDRSNPKVENLEWVTHKENIEYSAKANRYSGKVGANNPNFGNTTLHDKYSKDKKLSKEKQGRPGGKNGKAKPCILLNEIGEIKEFKFQREAVYYLVNIGIIPPQKYPETIIQKLKRHIGYKGYFLELA